MASSLRVYARRAPLLLQIRLRRELIVGYAFQSGLSRRQLARQMVRQAARPGIGNDAKQGLFAYLVGSRYTEFSDNAGLRAGNFDDAFLAFNFQNRLIDLIRSPSSRASR